MSSSEHLAPLSGVDVMAHCIFESAGYKVQFSSVAQSCPTLCDPMNCSTPGLPVHHQLPEDEMAGWHHGLNGHESE